MPKAFHWFEVYGIEAEYMIVEKETLKVLPIAEKILRHLNKGKLENEVECGEVAWSNELVSHVIELKCNGPTKNLEGLDRIFLSAIREVNQFLASEKAILMPTAMHPWMDVKSDTSLWPFGQKEIYNTYDRIFGCEGHGWSNLQSVHINLPFATEEEFVKLYNSIRIVLPLIPWIGASSPYYENHLGAASDNRLTFYEKNQKKVPSITGSVIPEPLSSYDDYQNLLERLYKDIAPYDDQKTLQEPWLNSRGAIAKMDVQAIEIRLLDIQETPYMDFSIIHLLVALLKKITTNSSLYKATQEISQDELVDFYQKSKNWDSFLVPSVYVKCFLSSASQNFSIEEFLKALFEEVKTEIPSYYHQGILHLLENGNLSHRLKKICGDLPQKAQYKKLIQCLNEDRMYV